jgi:MoaA/NifB/PqqE/SkfB family radical SAM enzyme
MAFEILLAILDYFQNIISRWFGIPLPIRVINFPITDNCNSKCVMCNVWKDKADNELTPIQIRAILGRNLFSKVKHLGVSGGEPTLREDLVQCIESILDSLVNLKTLSITSHGFHSKKWSIILPEIKKLCTLKGVSLSINISIDGVGVNHEKIRRIKNGWKQVEATINVVRSNNVKLQLQSTISKGNLYSVNEIAWYAKKLDIEVIFRMAVNIRRLYNENIISNEALNYEERGFLADFFASDLLASIKTSRGRRMYYQFMANELQKPLISRGSMPCIFQQEGVLIDSFGKMSPCSVTNLDFPEDALNIQINGDKVKHIRKKLVEKTCDGCVHDQSGRWSLRQLFWYEVSNYRIIHLLLTVNKLLIDLIRIRFTSPTVLSKKVLIVGAYGGEHVGDSAILGGVISRLNRIYGNVEYDVFSTRVSRTRFWTKTLSYHDQINVVSLKDCLQFTYQAVVYAGGPIMEDPIRLLKLLNLINRKRSHGSDFIIEGCGWGPFKTNFGKALAYKLVEKASSITLRDEFPDFYLQHAVKQDPAFDYLNGVDKAQDGLFHERLSEILEELSHNGSKVVAINLRPMWSKFVDGEFVTPLFMTKLLDDIVNSIPRDYSIA